jgi:hypothetical protein
VIPAVAFVSVPANANHLDEPPLQACQNIGDFPVCGRFLQVWSHQGNNQANVYVNGLPLSSQRSEI